MVDQSSIAIELQKYIQLASIHKSKRKKKEQPIINLNSHEVYCGVSELKQKLSLKDKSLIYQNIKLKRPIKGHFYQYQNIVNQTSIEFELSKCIQKHTHKMNCKRQKTCKKVICLTTNEVFESVAVVCERYNITPSSLYSAIRTKTKIAGLYWCYLKDCDSNTQITLDDITRLHEHSQSHRSDSIKRPVMNLNTGEVFESGVQAILKYTKTKNPKISIYSYIQKNSKLAGCYYQYVDIVEQSTRELELQKCIERAKKETQQRLQKTYKAVINLTTGERFESARKADEAYHSKQYGRVSAAINKHRPYKNCLWIYEQDAWASNDEMLRTFHEHYTTESKGNAYAV